MFDVSERNCFFYFRCFVGYNEPLDLCLDGVFADWVLRSLAQFLHRHSAGIAGAESLADGAGLLGSQVQRLVLLAAVQLAKILLCLLVHDNVAAGDGLADNAAKIETQNETTEVESGSHFNLHFGQLRWSTAGDFSDAKPQKLLLQVFELLGQLLFVLLTQF